MHATNWIRPETETLLENAMNPLTYAPSENLLEGIKTLFPLELLPWDDYYMRMAQGDFLCGRHQKRCSKTFFIRKAPFGGSYALFGGLTAYLRAVRELEFNDVVLAGLRDMGYRPEFLRYLKDDLRHLRLTIDAVEEGSVVFPHEPIVVLEGNLVSVRIAEGIMLKELNFPTLSLTKWHRVVSAASPGGVLEFARRRAQDSLRTSLYAHLAGCHVTSNAELRRGFKVPVVGTMGHEWVQSFGDEAEAFDKWLEFNPDRPTLLVDTIDTLRSGLPHAIAAFKKHRERIRDAGGKMGIRNDSGDLAYLTIEERIALDREGFPEVLIYETNDLDENLIQDIKEQIFTVSQRIGLDAKSILERIIWAAGTMPGTCYDQPSLGGVAKLTSIENGRGEMRAVIKLARDNPVKCSIPGSNRSFHAWKGEELIGCVIHDAAETPESLRIARHPDDYAKTLQLDAGTMVLNRRQKRVYRSEDAREEIFQAPAPTIQEVRDRIRMETARLHWTVKRFHNPHPVNVSLSPHVFGLRSTMIGKNLLIQAEG